MRASGDGSRQKLMQTLLESQSSFKGLPPGETGHGSIKGTEPTRMAGESASPRAHEENPDVVSDVANALSAAKRRPATGKPFNPRGAGDSELDGKGANYRTYFAQRSLAAFQYRPASGPSARPYQVYSGT